jgi:hypothetical protein
MYETWLVSPEPGFAWLLGTIEKSQFDGWAACPDILARAGLR